MAKKPDPIRLQVKEFTDRIENLLNVAAKKSQIGPLAQEAVRIIVKRTRLGYGLDTNMGSKIRLKAGGSGGSFKESYLKVRQRAKRNGILDGTASIKKVNLTFTGQLLRSVEAKVEDGKIYIAPFGDRNDGKKNQDIARYNEDAGRKFIGVTQLEFNQLLRFYRKSFTDLRRKLKLLK
jgi:hypothetical protein